MKKMVKKVLDSTTLDDRLARSTRRVAEKTDVDDKLFAASRKIHQEIKKNMGKAILAAFGFMIALVWRDVIKEGVNKLIDAFSMTGDGFIFTVMTAFATTFICIIGIIYFSRWSEKK